MQQKRYSSDLTERHWQRIAPLFVVQRTSKWPLRAMVNGIFYVLKNGCVWRDVPADLPPWVTVYYYFTKWSADGTWERVSGCLSITARERAKKGPAYRRYPRQSKRKKHGHQYAQRGLRRRQAYQGP